MEGGVPLEKGRVLGRGVSLGKGHPWSPQGAVPPSTGEHYHYSLESLSMFAYKMLSLLSTPASGPRPFTPTERTMTDVQKLSQSSQTGDLGPPATV